MADNGFIEFCILNIAATPHPRGVYENLLARAAGQPVNYRGSDYAAISYPIVSTEDDFLQGRIVCWTEIDKTQPAIDKSKLAEADLNDFDINLPDNLGFNGRVFLYTFRARDHKMFVEVKNEFGKRLSPRIAAKIIERLLSADVQGLEAPYVEVTVVPEEDALPRILGIHELKRLKIHLVRPNPDDVSDDAEEVLRDLEEQGAKSQDIIFVSTAKLGGVTPNERTEKQARVAELNGWVEGRGKDENGEETGGSTREYPKIIRWSVAGSVSLIASALRVARETVVGPRSGQDL